jgi:hypothetical protein
MNKLGARGNCYPPALLLSLSLSLTCFRPFNILGNPTELTATAPLPVKDAHHRGRPLLRPGALVMTRLSAAQQPVLFPKSQQWDLTPTFRVRGSDRLWQTKQRISRHTLLPTTLDHYSGHVRSCCSVHGSGGSPAPPQLVLPIPAKPVAADLSQPGPAKPELRYV